MRRIFATGLLLAIAIPCQAQGDKAKPNTLTPKEIADGWILLFDGETTFGWKINGGIKDETNPRADPPARIENGIMKLRGGLPVTSAHFNTSFGQEFEVQFDFRGKSMVARGETAQARRFLLLNEKDWLTKRFLLRNMAEKKVVEQFDLVEGKWVLKESYGRDNGGLEIFPLSLHVLYKENVELRNIKLRPLNTKSLFNAKDLTGWREFPGKKSKFAVVNGAINVKDGPGDLQTVSKYKDFILQLECISNGKHLNSGIFFRCRDNEYQNGYEAQIRNQFTPEATQKYLIEDYDPKTNKLLAKKEIMVTAFDYGTGAIYRRVPARKEMSKDGAWFGMTIVAHGNHLATWVNGVQVTDWYDNRPKSDNARTGCRLEAGHISIQGHDPTTDLSFKNFRIAELK